MKNQLFFIFLLGLFFKGHSQIPVMNSIQGSGTVCSVPASGNSYTASASNSPTSFYWSVQPSGGVNISSPNSAVTTIDFPQSIGIYTVYCAASNSSGTCTPISYTVAVYQTPMVTFSGANSFCQGSSTNLQASSTILIGSPTISYFWSPSTGLNTTTGSIVNASPANTTTYNVTATAGFCSSTSSIVVTVNPLPVINIASTPSVLCNGSIGTLSITGTGIAYYINSIPTPTLAYITPSVTTTYVISAVNAQGCGNNLIFTQIVSSCIGIKENTEAIRPKLLLYPNPSNGYVSVLTDQNDKAYIINSLGQTIRIIDLLTDSENRINDLKPGVYFIITSTSRIKFIVE